MDAPTTKTSKEINSFIKTERDVSDQPDFFVKVATEIQRQAQGQSKLNSVNYTQMNFKRCNQLAQNKSEETIQGLIEVILYLLTCVHAPDRHSNCVLCTNALAILQHKFKILDRFDSFASVQNSSTKNSKPKRLKENSRKTTERSPKKTIPYERENWHARRPNEHSPYSTYPTYDYKYAVYYNTTDKLDKRLHHFNRRDYSNSYVMFNKDKVDNYSAGHYFRMSLLDFEYICVLFHNSKQDHICRKQFGYRIAEMERLIWHPVFKTKLTKFLNDYKESPIRVIKTKVLNRALSE